MKVAFFSTILYEFDRPLVAWWTKPGFYYKPGHTGPDLSEPDAYKLPPPFIWYRSSDRIGSLDQSHWWYTGKGSLGIQTCFFRGAVEWWRDYDRQYATRGKRELEDMEGIGVKHSKAHSVLGTGHVSSS